MKFLIIKILICISLLLITSYLLFSCNNNKTFNNNHDLQKIVNKVVGKKQKLPKEKNFNNINWKCSQWLIKFYNNNENIGNWNSFEKNITNNEKNQIYYFKNNYLNIVNNEQNRNIRKVYKYEWDNNGNLLIDNILFICKLENNKFYMYFNTNDNEKIGEIFNISVDRSFRKAISPFGFQELGMIEFTQKPYSIISNDLLDLDSKISQ